MAMDATELAETIEAAQRHDGKAYDRLVEAYGRRLYGFFHRQTGARQDAEDLLQDLFVRVVRGIGKYRHEDNFDGWIFRIATNLVRDRARRRKRRPVEVVAEPTNDDDGDGMLGRAESPEVGPAEAVERNDELGRLQRALGQLPDRDREVILLRHFSQLSFKEIAETLGCPLGTVLARGHRSLAKLRKMMEDRDGA